MSKPQHAPSAASVTSPTSITPVMPTSVTSVLPPHPNTPTTPVPTPISTPIANNNPNQPSKKHVARSVPSLRFPSCLTFSPAAWLQLQFLCHAGDTEIGAFGIALPDNPFYIVALGIIRQRCTHITVEFDDSAVADFFDDQIDQGRTPEQFGRVWIHTHPGDSAHPSGVDEQTFDRVFGRCEWAIMFILAKGGETTCRLRMTASSSSGARLAIDRTLAVRVDWASLGSCPVINALGPWWQELQDRVEELMDCWPEHAHFSQGRQGRPGQALPRSRGDEQVLLDWFDSLDPDEQQAFIDGMPWDRLDHLDHQDDMDGVLSRSEPFDATSTEGESLASFGLGEVMHAE